MVVLILSILAGFFKKMGDMLLSKTPDSSKRMAKELLIELENSEKGILTNPFLGVEPDRELFFNTLTQLAEAGCKIRVHHPYSSASELPLEEQYEWLLIER